MAQEVKSLTAVQENQIGSLGQEDLLEKGKAIPGFLPGEFQG